MTNETYHIYPDFRTDALRPFALAVGEFALAWNSLQDAMGLLFGNLLAINVDPFKGWETTLATPPSATIWHSITSDRNQREVLDATAKQMLENKLTTPEAALDHILHLTQCVNKLEQKRNNVIHAPIMLKTVGTMSEAIPSSLGHKRANNLKGIRNLLREVGLCYDESISLRDYCRAIDFALWRHRSKQVYALPDKWRPPNRGETN